ncbi:hypothetical protein SAMN06295998_1306 [Primorskyibacter flagellatus]|uniref:Uncharacterized protein n=1 Tax=Primorskyibacter flagellatus TaxID=1387277 RepID=A0A1W2EID4_9RHOB|nr:hypothetical protein SAMN06295998_1306 [Primorskyibacter flagellatus]
MGTSSFQSSIEVKFHHVFILSENAGLIAAGKPQASLPAISTRRRA